MRCWPSCALDPVGAGAGNTQHAVYAEHSVTGDTEHAKPGHAEHTEPEHAEPEHSA